MRETTRAKWCSKTKRRFTRPSTKVRRLSHCRSSSARSSMGTSTAAFSAAASRDSPARAATSHISSRSRAKGGDSVRAARAVRYADFTLTRGHVPEPMPPQRLRIEADGDAHDELPDHLDRCASQVGRTPTVQPLQGARAAGGGSLRRKLWALHRDDWTLVLATPAEVETASAEKEDEDDDDEEGLGAHGAATKHVPCRQPHCAMTDKFRVDA